MMSKESHECFRFTVSQTSYHFSAKFFNPAHVNELFGAVHEVRFKQIHRQRSIYDRQTCSEFFFKKKKTRCCRRTQRRHEYLNGTGDPGWVI